MIPRRLADVARVVGGTRRGDDVEVGSVSIDSRTVTPGALFVAIPGDRHDGHTFVEGALDHGAAGVLVRDGFPTSSPAVHVASTSEALLRLAADERSRMDATVVGVTGANGKTSTKDLARRVVAVRRQTHASPGSFNNEVGLPLTLLGAPGGTEVVIAEMGARHLGDVKVLSGIARPDVVVVTNVGVAHMEVFGSWASIVEAAAEPVEALEPDGIAILNADDPVVAGYRERSAARVVTFGRDAGADVRADSVTLDPTGRASFRATAGGRSIDVTLAVPGEHMVSNALAALAVGLEIGVGLDEAGRALADARVSPWRMETFTTPDGVRVLNDAYNANPESVAAAIRTARWMAGDERLIAVLGEMAELGTIADREHERVGELVARVRVDRLITVGGPARGIARTAIAEGMERTDVATYDDVSEAIADVRRSIRAGDLVLCKGSRVAGLEAVAEALR